jgi:uncharacterized membrane protein
VQGKFSQIQIRDIVAIMYGIPFIWIGIQHFVDPSWFEPIVPEVLGNARFWVLVSGVFEIALGLAIMFPKFRKIGSLGIAAMLVVLYWANLNMWINGIAIGGTKLPLIGHIIRGIIQFLLIMVALWIGELTPFNKKMQSNNIEDKSNTNSVK